MKAIVKTARPFVQGESLSVKFAARLMGWFALASLSAMLSSAQQTTPPSKPYSSAQEEAPAPGQDTASEQQATADKDKEGQNKAQGEVSGSSSAGTSKDRLFYALPNFLSLENEGKIPPLTAKQKFAVVARGTFDPVQFPWWGLLSAISQADDSTPAYGQGFEGYAKRYGTTAADSIIENFLTSAVFPSVLLQDPRFFQSSTGGFARRSCYAVSLIFVTRSDYGQSQFNYSEIAGSVCGRCHLHLQLPSEEHVPEHADELALVYSLRPNLGERVRSLGDAGRPRHVHDLVEGILA